jgi:putative FmdB family regulatory protein
MPIYAYRCEACGHAQDVLQKLSDPVLTTCPACGAERFVKQVTAAGFQLKGSGWYVTDFRNGGGGAKKPETSEKTEAADAGAKAGATPEGAGTAPAPGPAPAATTPPAASPPAPSAAGG